MDGDYNTRSLRTKRKKKESRERERKKKLKLKGTKQMAALYVGFYLFAEKRPTSCKKGVKIDDRKR